MNRIDLYVAEVGRHLPAKSRADIERELRSLLQDALDDAAEKAGRAPDEEMELAVLRASGSPEKVAASYSRPRYLIGPRLYPLFWLVLRIVVVVITILSLITLGLSIGRAPADGQAIATALARGLGSLFAAVVGAFGNIVLVFAILERLMPDWKMDEEEWDPRDLKAEPDPDQVKPGGPIGEIVGAVIALVVLNVYPQWLGINTYVDGRWQHAPVLSEAFMSFVPWISIVLVLGITLQAFVLRQGKWTRELRWASIGVHLANIVLTAVLLATPNLIQVDSAQLATFGWDMPSANALVRAEDAFNLLFRMALGISLITTTIELAKKLYALVAPRLNLPASLSR